MAWDYAALAKAPQTYFDAVDAQDVELIVSHFADDATLTIQTANVTHNGKDEIRRMFTDFTENSVFIEHQIHNMVVEADKGKVSTEQDYRGELNDGTKNDMYNCNFFDFNEAGEFQRVIIWMAGTSPLV
ncbi:MAG: nuclear transport factor 2 family protein [Actinomycetota bacterium]